MAKQIQLPNTLKKLAETRNNLDMMSILIDQYIPDKCKFVKQKVKKEQVL